MTNPARIVIIGEALIDRFPTEDVVGGAPFNVARGLAAFGVDPLMITRVGADADAAIVGQEFTRFGLSARGLQVDPQRKTGLVTVTLTASGHQFSIGADQAWDAIDTEAALQTIHDVPVSALCFGTLAQRSTASRSAIHEVLQAAKAKNANIVLDLNLRASGNTAEIAEASLRAADVVKVNDDELFQLIRWFVLPNTDALQFGTPALLVATRSLIAQFSLRSLIVTRGAEGYIAFDETGIVAASSPRGQVVAITDTVGAGDGFLAVVLLGYTRGWPLPLTLTRANAFAARVCSLRGAVTTDLDFYRREQAMWNTEKVS